MTDIVSPPSIDALPAAPLPSDTPASFDAKAFASLAAQVAFVSQANALGSNVHNNAIAADERASSAASSATTASTQAGNATSAAAASQAARDESMAYAQAAGASAGVPTPTPNKVLSTNASGVVAWRDAPSDPAVANKLDKSGGVATKLAYTYIDQGTIAAGGTVNISALTATVHRVQAAGNLTITFADLITGSLSGDIELHCVNFGGKTVTWPAGNWVKNDGSYAAAVGNSGVTWQAAGTDRVLVMIDNGSITYKVMR